MRRGGEIDAEVGAPEAVDGLLRIPDHVEEVRARLQKHALRDGPLALVGVLELVDERRVEASAQGLSKRLRSLVVLGAQAHGEAGDHLVVGHHAPRCQLALVGDPGGGSEIRQGPSLREAAERLEDALEPVERGLLERLAARSLVELVVPSRPDLEERLLQVSRCSRSPSRLQPSPQLGPGAGVVGRDAGEQEPDGLGCAHRGAERDVGRFRLGRIHPRECFVP